MNEVDFQRYIKRREIELKTEGFYKTTQMPQIAHPDYFAMTVGREVDRQIERSGAIHREFAVLPINPEGTQFMVYAKDIHFPDSQRRELMPSERIRASNSGRTDCIYPYEDGYEEQSEEG